MKSASLAFRKVLDDSKSVQREFLSYRQAQITAGIAVLLTDFFAMSVGLGGLYLLAFISTVDLGLTLTVLSSLVPLLFVGLMVGGLYTPLFIHPAQEIKLTSYVVAVVVVVSCTLLAVYGASLTVIGHLALAGAVLLMLLPIFRGLVRIYLGSTSWWGMPVVVFSDEETGPRVVELLRRWPELGLRPAALVQEDARSSEHSHDVPILRGLEKAAEFSQEHTVGCAIVARPNLDHHQLGHLLDRQGKFFRHMFVIPESGLAQCMWSTAKSYDGLVGFAVQHYTWRKPIRAFKTAVDKVFAGIGLVLLFPFMLAAAVWIKLDSAGPIFFKQERMGRSGRCFEVYKFRTMYQDAEERLEELLKKDAQLREEYWLYHKLSDDPRITRVGRFLRRYSIDELPQLMNVVLGDMSLVGPRAYMPGELSKMNGMARAVLQSPPGLTGLWQVSGRNLLSFEERVDLDMHYLQNWSPWLDFYILLRTIPVVTSGEGAR